MHDSTNVVLGIDIGGTKTLGVAITAEAEVIAEVRLPTVEGSAGVIDLLAEMVTGLQSAVGADAAIGGVGIGIAGLVDHEGNLRRAPNLTDADDFAVGELLTPRVRLPVVVDNDANCAARAELRLGAAVGSSDAVLVALGTGIGGAIIVSGEVQRGAAGMAGEIGHMVVHPDGPDCPCGGRGCWERFASGAGLAHLARLAAADGALEGVVADAGGVEHVRGEHVTGAARRGDQGSIAVLDTFARWIALGMANIAAITDPELFVVGGGLVRDWDLFGDGVRRHFSALLVAGSHRPPIRIAPATAGDAAGAIGAALLAAERGV